LRNTEFIFAVAIYQGHDTKVMQNSAKGKYKFSQLELAVNKSIIIVFCLSLFLSMIGSIIGAGYGLDKKAIPNFLYPDSKLGKIDMSFVVWFFFVGGSWILLFTNFVPISMLVSLEIVKFW
jgi:phospholipid-transporting ATPase